jgi:hypothetical protein
VAKRVSGRTFLVGATAAVLGLVTEGIAAWVRKEAPPSWAPIATAAVTVLVAGLTAVAEKSADTAVELPGPMQPAYPGAPAGFPGAPLGYPGGPAAYPGGPMYPGSPVGYRPPYRPAAPRKRGIGLAFALVLVLVLFGAGGWAASVFVSKTIATFRSEGLAPWQQPLGNGTERLTESASADASGVTLTVTSVKVYEDETVVSVSAHNDNGDSAHIPVFEAVVLNVPGANSLKPDLPRTDGTWTEDVGAGSDVTGSIAFSGTVAAGATSATIVFNHVLAGFNSATIQVPLQLDP